MKELVFDVYKWFGEIVFEAHVYDGREISYTSISYTSEEEDVFKAMKELQEEYGEEYEVLFRMEAEEEDL